VPRPPQLIASCFATLCLAFPWLNPFNFGPSVTVVSVLVAWSCAVGLGLCFVTLLAEREARWRVLLWGWALAAGVSALMGLFQYFDRAQLLGSWVNYAGLGQAFGNLRQRNQFATLCSMGLVLLWWWAQVARARAGSAQSVAGPSATSAIAPTSVMHGELASPLASTDAAKTWVSTALTVALLAGASLVCAASAASSSRTGFLQLLLLLVLAWCWRPSAPEGGRMYRGLGLVGFMVLAYVLAAVLLPFAAGVDGSVFERMRESPDGCASRVALYRNVLHLIAQKPLIGWGWGELDFAHFMTLYTTPLAGVRFCAILDNAHNLPLQLAVELGLPLALLLCALLLVWLLRNKPWAERVPQRQLAWGLLAMVGLHSLLEYPLWYGPFQVAAVLCLWVLHAYPAQHAGDPAAHAGASAAPTSRLALGTGLRKYARWFAVPVLALLCALVSWNYWRMSQLYLTLDSRAPAYRDNTYAKVQDTWFFGGHVDFAVLSVTPVTEQTAPYLLELGERLLHFSPEAKVVEKILDAALVLGREDKIAFYAPRFAAAFPEDYQRWRQAHAK
jgi:O-antigen ligase